jgi:hypothetical protein
MVTHNPLLCGDERSKESSRKASNSMLLNVRGVEDEPRKK